MNVRLKYDMHFTAGIYYNDGLRMNNYSLRLWMTTNSENTADQNISFEQQVRNYVEKNKIKVYILTPCFASLCYVNYVHCLMNTIEIFRRLNIPLKIEFCKSDRRKNRKGCRKRL